MNEFYAYYILTCDLRDRVGGVNPEDAKRRLPPIGDMLRRAATDTTGNSALLATDLQLVNLMPRCVAEEHALNGFDGDFHFYRREGCGSWNPKPSAPPVVSGTQYLWTAYVTARVSISFIVDAPTHALAAARADDMASAVTAALPGYLTEIDVAHADVTVSSVTPWIPYATAGAA